MARRKHTKGNLCGKRIKLARVSKNMAQVELAAAMEVDFKIECSQTTISEIELGKRLVRDIELAAFAEILDISPTWLLFGDAPPKFANKPLRS